MERPADGDSGFVVSPGGALLPTGGVGVPGLPLKQNPTEEPILIARINDEIPITKIVYW